MRDASADQGVATDERKRLAFDKSILFLFLVGGSVSVVVLKTLAVPLPIRIGVPVTLILLYASLTLLRTRFRLRYDQAGDNCYYMGFIFTLVSLGVALYLIRGGVSVQEYGIGVVRDFGLALSTTVVGIICRVSLTQMREDPHDIEEAVRRELIEHSRALSGQLRASVGMLAEVRQTTEDRLKTYVYEMRQVVEEHHSRAKELRDATQLLANGVKSLADDLVSVEIPTGKMRDAAEAVVGSIENLAATSKQAGTAFAQIDTAAGLVVAGYEKAASASVEAANQGAKAAAGMVQGADASAALAAQLRELIVVLSQAASGAEAYKSMSEDVKALTDALRFATRSIASANSRLTVAEGTLTAQTEVAERAARSLTTQLEALAAAHARLAQAQIPTAPTIVAA